MGMTHRERVLRALNHQEPDRVPLDLGGTLTSTITYIAHQRVMAHLGLPGEAPIIRKWASAMAPNEGLLRQLDVDTRMVVPPYGEQWNEYWRILRLPKGESFRDEWGMVWTKPESGPYFISHHPLAGDDVSIEDLAERAWPNPDDLSRLAGLKEQARDLKENSDYAVIGIFPRPIVSLSQFIRGYQNWFLDMGMNKGFLEALMDAILEVDLKIGERLLGEIGKYVDLMFVHDDLATQQSLMFSPQDYRQIVKPRHGKIFNLIKSHSDAKIIYHCDGAIHPIIEDFIEIGVDALNPVQVSAQGMDSGKLKTEFKGRLCFWGAVDTQRVLPNGSPDEVRQEVKRQIDALGPGGGYVLAAVHNIQDDVPPENIVAMFEAARELGQYPLATGGN